MMEAGRATQPAPFAPLAQNIPPLPNLAPRSTTLSNTPQNRQNQPKRSPRNNQGQNSRSHVWVNSEQGPRQGRPIYRQQGPQREPQPAPAPPHDAQDNKVHVSGFPAYTAAAELVHALAGAGGAAGGARLLRFSPRHSVAVLAFATKQEADNAIQTNKKINIYGEFLKVRKYDDKDGAGRNPPARIFPKSKEKDSIVAPSELDLSGEFHAALQRVLGAVRLTQEEAARVGRLYCDLEAALRDHWPDCVAMPFGSITTGLGIKSSDADCFVQLPARLRRPGDQLVNRAKRILQAQPHLFAEILSIPRANTPIVKFFHLPTGTNCDLSFKTPLGTQNSKLISFLLHADPRLIPVSVVIKYWAKVHGLSGTGRLTNYALTMMIIFYLQQPPVRMLPSVVSLQRDPVNDVIVDHWNTGFLAEPLPPSACTASIPELLGGFFEYYSLFNFDNMVVCPYTGEPVPKNLFKDLTALPPEFERYKENVLNGVALPLKFTTTMCVQDPFEQSHNVASAITGKLASEIKAYFKFAANAYEKEKTNDYKGFLKTILLEKPKIIKAKAHPEYRINLFHRMLNIVDPDWKSVIRECTFDVFEKMLKIKLGKVEEKVNPDSKKEKEKYSGLITKALWRRKHIVKKYNLTNLDLLTKQMKITEDVLNQEINSFECHFHATLTFAHEPRSAVVAIKFSTGSIGAFNEFGMFFISIVQNWFSQLLKPHTAPVGPETKASIRETIKHLDQNMIQNEEGVDSSDDDVSQDDHRKDDSSKHVINKDNVSKGDVSKDAVSKDDVSYDDVSKVDVSKDDVRKDGISKDDISKVEVRRDDVSKDDAPECVENREPAAPAEKNAETEINTIKAIE